MVTAIIGRKVGMTQVFGADGVVTPVTVLKASSKTSARMRRTLLRAKLRSSPALVSLDVEDNW